jgi:hypothetical protein
MTLSEDMERIKDVIMPIYDAGGSIGSKWFQGPGIQKVDDTAALNNFSPKKKSRLLHYSDKGLPVKLTAN